MNAHDKNLFIRSLCDSVVETLVKKIPEMPEEWNGHELRELLAIAFKREATLSKNTYAIGPERIAKVKRLRAFNKERLARGIL